MDISFSLLVFYSYNKNFKTSHQSTLEENSADGVVVT